ncbi:hypothetical protein H5410_038820 [Solanum commersonii]|uniref:Uncharacterized protein n=1 Tax=Solanum commersonii TaxID=4109 RepID=A0A9J5YE96_SOLCO|nr:hypothetical protein H5410_038820 [Solanum commersonii]
MREFIIESDSMAYTVSKRILILVSGSSIRLFNNIDGVATFLESLSNIVYGNKVMIRVNSRSPTEYKPQGFVLSV